MQADPRGEQLSLSRHRLGAATQHLLGAAGALDEDAWRRASRLPGWSRGHLATHLARQADALRRLAEGARTGERQQMYAPGQREQEIDAGAARTGRELRADLDASARHLEETFDSLDRSGRWDAEIELRDGVRVPARTLPLGRLCEVVLHHVDLDVGFGVADVDAVTAAQLLTWCALRLRDRADVPRLELRPDGGEPVALGAAGEPRTVTGSAAELLGWLTRRSPGHGLTGTGGLRLPAF